MYCPAGVPMLDAQGQPCYHDQIRLMMEPTMEESGHFPLPCQQDPRECQMHASGIPMRNPQTGVILTMDNRPSIMYPSLD